jgi:hypothetical protein
MWGTLDTKLILRKCLGGVNRENLSEFVHPISNDSYYQLHNKDIF